MPPPPERMDDDDIVEKIYDEIWEYRKTPEYKKVREQQKEAAIKWNRK